MSILFWALLAIGLAVIEIVSLTFFPIFFAISAVLAGIAEVAGASPLLQWGIFGVGGLILSAGLRPIARRQMDKGPTLSSNVESLRGRIGTVSTAIDGRSGTGAVNIDGDIWSAKPAGDGLAQIPVGADVEIYEVRGATLVVTPVPTTEVP